MATPTKLAVRLGAIMSNAANKQESCSQRFISTNMNLLKEAAMSVMPKIQPVKVMMKLSQVKPLATSSKEGENTKTKGTKALAEALKNNKTIITLDLTWNKIGAEGIKALAKVLETNTTITALKLNSYGDRAESKNFERIIDQRCKLNAQKASIANNIAGALDLLTDAQNKNKVNITSVPEVNNLIAQKIFVLDKEDKLNNPQTIYNPEKVINKYA